MKTAADPCTLLSTSKTHTLTLQLVDSLPSTFFFKATWVCTPLGFSFSPLSILPHYSLPVFTHFPANSFNMGLDLASLYRNTRFFIANLLFCVEPFSSISYSPLLPVLFFAIRSLSRAVAVAVFDQRWIFWNFHRHNHRLLAVLLSFKPDLEVCPRCKPCPSRSQLLHVLGILKLVLGARPVLVHFGFVLCP